MSIPVAVLYSLREDRSISIDAVSVPSEDELYHMVDANAGFIREAVEREIDP
jgi:hypothetical protein